MKVSYDPMADAMYIYFSKNKKSSRTEEVTVASIIPTRAQSI